MTYFKVPLETVLLISHNYYLLLFEDFVDI